MSSTASGTDASAAGKSFHRTRTSTEIARISVRLVWYIWNRYLRGASFSAIAEETGPAKSMAHNAFQHRLEIMDEPLTPGDATVLSMDEIHLRGHGYLAVFVDPESKEVIEVLRGIDKP
ncbi:hypothetical protein GGQ07_002945 [Salinibacter ruber]|uniref:hypothetical protein n=1 Tax=Salinibacter ruber TaxID=146919 RepID=UPI002166D5A9|nr:hypothetical protein [Salinibacter ruber]MCS4116109.1 hypothetical protein [Salinibacter ruber]MCS4181488.1 hypothetical protein [Salinibacter ruber]